MKTMNRDGSSAVEERGILKHTEYIDIRERDMDGSGIIRPGRMLYFFQEISSHHADAMSIGFDDLIKKNLIWVLSKVRYRMYGKTEAGKYTLVTCPRPGSSAVYRRDYYLRDEAGELKATGTSHWCVVNYETRRIERADIDFSGEFVKEDAFEDDIKRIGRVDGEPAGIRLIRAEDMDKNGHTNNCRYADMAEEAAADLTEGQGMREFSINFSRETKEGDRISLFLKREKNTAAVEGRTSEGAAVFRAEISL